MGIYEDNSNCDCKADNKENLFAPLKGKMKVLKKIRKRMGFG